MSRLLARTVVTAAFVPLFVGARATNAPLHLDVYTAGDSAFRVNSTLIYGPTEIILVDAQFRNSDAAKVADRIAATHRRLKAIILTHAHDDHYDGTALFLARFPGTPVYISAAGLQEFHRVIATQLPRVKAFLKADAPDSVPTPQVFPTTPLTVDGQAVEITTDRQGDVLAPSNSFVWIPSLRAVIAGDIVFDNVHVWMPESNVETRAAWLGSLQQLDALHPRIVVAGHQKGTGVTNNADAIAFTRRYLTTFDEERKAAANADSLIATMTRKYPDVAVPYILVVSAKTAYKPAAQ